MAFGGGGSLELEMVESSLFGGGRGDGGRGGLVESG